VLCSTAMLETLTKAHEQPNALEEIPTLVWRSLGEAVCDRRHPFRLMSLATMSGEGIPRARMVVLRGADEAGRRVRFHCDARSRKANELARSPFAAILWYEPVHRLQVRMEGRAAVHHNDGTTTTAWESMQPMARECYRAPLPPGTPIEAPYEAPPPLYNQALSAPNRAALDAKTQRRLAVSEVEVSVIDFLCLRASGHVRAVFEWDGDAWDGSWVSP